MRSDNVKTGVDKAPHRSLMKALGWTDREIKMPMIGVVCAQNEIIPGHMELRKIADAVKAGVRENGGNPVEFPVIGVCDGIAMGHQGMTCSLPSRELIADSIEVMATAHQFDALVFIPNCDKIVPGMLMAAARLNLPSIFVSGGPMLAGHVKGGDKKGMSLSSMFEAVGRHAAGTLSDDELLDWENSACPTCGSCSGMYTANSMNCLTEAIGMGLPGNGTIPAVYSERIRLAKEAGYQVMELLKKGITARMIMTEAAFMNALKVDMALGCSTNTMLHLPAIAHEAGIDIDIFQANSISASVPNLCHLAHIAATAFQSSGFFSFRCCQKTTNTFFKLLKNVVSEQIFREKTLTPPHLEKATDLSNYPTLIGVYSAKQNIYSFLICIYEFLHPSA